MIRGSFASSRLPVQISLRCVVVGTVGLLACGEQSGGGTAGTAASGAGGSGGWGSGSASGTSTSASTGSGASIASGAGGSISTGSGGAPSGAGGSGGSGGAPLACTGIATEPPVFGVEDRLAIGVSDSTPKTFQNPSFPGLGVRHARTVRPFDVALRDCGDPADIHSRANWEAWLNGAIANGVEPFVVFVSTGPYPTPDEFEQAFVAFRAAYPGVRRFAAWNEPNSSAYEVHEHPEVAAAYWLRANQHCNGDCVVAAGEMMDWPGDPAFHQEVPIAKDSPSYAARYMAHLGDARPALWSFHAWHDVAAYQQNGAHCLPQEGPGGDPSLPPCRIRWFGHLLRGSWSKATIWLTEQGPYWQIGCEDWNVTAKFADSHTCTDIPHLGTTAPVFVFGEEWQKKTAQFLLNDLASADARITRVYLYDFQAECSVVENCKLGDTGLVSPWVASTNDPGTPREVYGLVAGWPGKK